MKIAIRSINGISNTVGGLAGQRRADDRFQVLTKAVRRIQLAGGLGLRVEKKDEQNVSLITFRVAHTDELENEVRLVRELLDIDMGQLEIPLVFGAVRKTNQELAVLSRSMLDVMSALGAYIEVPENHVVEGGPVKIYQTILPG